MAEAKWERYAAATGIVGAALLAIQAAVVAFPPQIDDPVDVVGHYYFVHRIAVQWQIFLIGVASVFLLWFLGSLRSHLRAAEAGTGRLSAVAFGSAIAAAAPISVGALATAVLALEVGRLAVTSRVATYGPSEGAPFGVAVLVRVLHDMRLVSWSLSWFALAPFFAAVAVITFRNSAFPRWYGQTAYALFFVAIVAGAGVFASTGVFAPGGIVSYTAFALFLVWTAVTSRLLMSSVEKPAGAED
jgi:hypothetical protein